MNKEKEIHIYERGILVGAIASATGTLIGIIITILAT